MKVIFKTKLKGKDIELNLNNRRSMIKTLSKLNMGVLFLSYDGYFKYIDNITDTKFQNGEYFVASWERNIKDIILYNTIKRKINTPYHNIVYCKNFSITKIDSYSIIDNIRADKSLYKITINMTEMSYEEINNTILIVENNKYNIIENLKDWCILLNNGENMTLDNMNIMIENGRLKISISKEYAKTKISIGDII